MSPGGRRSTSLRESARRVAWWLLARARSRWALRLRRLPVVGTLVHAVSHRLWPRGRRTPLRVRSGLVAGMTLELDPRYESKLWNGRLELEVQERLRALVRPGATVWDVGASIGFFTLALARLVGSEGLVVAFEPDPAAAALLRRHLGLNRIANVDVRQVAVWSAAGDLRFGIAPDDRGRTHGRVGYGAEHVAAVTLDEALAFGPPPSVVKIDVEGAEEEVLHGATRLLAEHAPIVVCEVHLERGRQAGRLDRVRSLLEAHGYAVEQLDGAADPAHIVARPRPAIA
jgi:FkbM family methyltransferase